MIYKLFILSGYFLSAFSQQCFTDNDVLTSNKLFSYNGNVYDITGYNHPGGQATLIRTVGGSLETYVNQPKYIFHLSSNRFDIDLSGLFVGVLNNDCAIIDPSTTPIDPSTQPPSTQPPSTQPPSTQPQIDTTTQPPSTQPPVDTTTQPPSTKSTSVKSTSVKSTIPQSPSNQYPCSDSPCVITKVNPTSKKPGITNNSSTVNIKYNNIIYIMFFYFLI